MCFWGGGQKTAGGRQRMPITHISKKLLVVVVCTYCLLAQVTRLEEYCYLVSQKIGFSSSSTSEHVRTKRVHTGEISTSTFIPKAPGSTWCSSCSSSSCPLLPPACSCSCPLRQMWGGKCTGQCTHHPTPCLKLPSHLAHQHPVFSYPPTLNRPNRQCQTDK